MCVDYHCREEVGMDIPEDEGLIKRYENKKELFMVFMTKMHLMYYLQ